MATSEHPSWASYQELLDFLKTLKPEQLAEPAKLWSDEQEWVVSFGDMEITTEGGEPWVSLYLLDTGYECTDLPEEEL